jgi:hypothetical protein
MPRKKIINNLCDLRVLCGEILLENSIGFHEVSTRCQGVEVLKPEHLPARRLTGRRLETYN